MAHSPTSAPLCAPLQPACILKAIELVPAARPSRLPFCRPRAWREPSCHSGSRASATLSPRPRPSGSDPAVSTRVPSPSQTLRALTTHTNGLEHLFTCSLSVSPM